MTTRNLTLSEVMRTAIDRGIASVRVGLPGRIEKFDPATQLADVKPLLKESIEIDGVEQVEDLPVLPQVPVQFIGGNGYAITVPVVPGDLCWLTFADRSLDRWSGLNGVVDPVVLDRHSLTDAVAFLGIRNQPSKLSEFDNARAVFGNKGPRVAVDGSAVHLGVMHQEAGTQSAIRGTAYRAAEDTLLDGISTQATAAATSLQTAGVALTTAAPLNAVPMVGGVAAAPSILAAATAINAAAVALNLIQGLVLAFKAQGATFLIDKVKTP